MSYATAVAESVYVLDGRDGRRYVIYNAEAIGNPSDHRPSGWYFKPHPAPLGFRPKPRSPRPRRRSARRWATTTTGG